MANQKRKERNARGIRVLIALEFAGTYKDAAEARRIVGLALDTGDLQDRIAEHGLEVKSVLVLGTEAIDADAG